VRGADTELEEDEPEGVANALEVPWADAQPAKPETAMQVIAAVLSFVIVTYSPLRCTRLKDQNLPKGLQKLTKLGHFLSNLG
jgi:hypothetical protein